MVSSRTSTNSGFGGRATSAAGTACAKIRRQARRVVFGLGCCSALAIPASAESLQSLHIWVAGGTAEVFADTAIPDHVGIEVLDVAELDRGEKVMNDWIQSRLDPSLSGDDLMSDYKRLAAEFVATPGFEQMKEHITLGAHAIEAAVYFKVAKVPAIVINERYTIYNVASLKEAIEIFERKVP